jgi:hypothetical protein
MSEGLQQYDLTLYCICLLVSSFDPALVDIPCIVSGKGSICYFFHSQTYTLDQFSAALHVHMGTKAQLEFDPQLLSLIVCVGIDGLVVRGDLVFTMLRTYTSSKSGLSTRKSELNLGDATVSLRMVNEGMS